MRSERSPDDSYDHHHDDDDDDDDDDDVVDHDDNDDNLAGQQRYPIHGRVADVSEGQCVLLIMIAVMMTKIVRLIYNHASNKTGSDIYGVTADCHRCFSHLICKLV